MKSKDKLTYYCIGILKGQELTECHMATTDFKEAKAEAQKTNKNVYELKDNKYFLRKIFAKPVRTI